MASFNSNDRIIGKWDGSNFIEEKLTLSGADGIQVSVDSTQFTISGNSSAVTSGYEAADVVVTNTVTSGYIAADVVVTSGYTAADVVVTNTVTSGYIAADVVVTSGYTAADVVVTNTVTSGYIAADAALSGAIDGKFVELAGDTMTGPLYLSEDPQTSGQAANKHYVDIQIAGAAVQVQDHNTLAVDSASVLDFSTGLQVTSGAGEAIISVKEDEFTSVVFLTGAQTISGDKQFMDNVTVRGNLNVSGTLNQINTEELLVEDNKVVLNSTWTGTATEDASLKVERGTDPFAQLLWNETDDRWEVGVSGVMGAIVVQSGLDAVSSGYAAADVVVTNTVTSGYTAADVVVTNTVTSGYIAADVVVTNTVTSGYIAADVVVTSGYTAADVVVTNTVTSGYIAADVVVTNTVTSGYIAADVVVTSGYTAADVVVTNTVTSGYEAADVVVTNTVTSGYIAADVVVTNTVTSGYIAADVALSGVLDGQFVHLIGDESIAGVKTFTSPVVLASGLEPALISSSGISGEARWADDYLYICVAANTWKRVALASF